MSIAKRNRASLTVPGPHSGGISTRVRAVTLQVEYCGCINRIRVPGEEERRRIHQLIHDQDLVGAWLTNGTVLDLLDSGPFEPGALGGIGTVAPRSGDIGLAEPLHVTWVDGHTTRRVIGVSASGNYRKRMRAQGMRPIQLWVADVRAPGFADEAHRQSAAVATSGHADDDQAFIDALSRDDK